MLLNRNGKKPLHLIQMVDTRWNSEYLMLERMERVKEPLSQVLSKDAHLNNLTGREWISVKELLQAMKPLYEATEISCGKKYPTISMIIPLINGIKRCLQAMTDTSTVNPSMRSRFAKYIVEFLDERFDTVLTNTLYHKCTFMDPRYKTHFLDADENEDTLKAVKRELMSEVKDILVTSRPDNRPASNPVSPIPRDHIGKSYLPCTLTLR